MECVFLDNGNMRFLTDLIPCSMMTIPIDAHLFLEPIALRHSKPLYTLADSNRSYLRVWLPWVDHMHSEEFMQQNIERILHRCATGHEYVFVLVYRGELTGRIGIHKIDKQNRIGEIGYWIAEEAQGKGIVTRACRALVQFGFETVQLNRMEIKCGTGNRASQAIDERLGFKQEGVLQEAEYLNGRYLDLNLNALLKGDWSTDKV